MTVAYPLEKDVVDFREYTGRTRALESVEIRARVKGYLRSVEDYMKGTMKDFEEGTVVEKGDVLFYMQRSGSLAETNEYLKLGRVRLRLDPNPFDSPKAVFQQELKLREGHVEIRVVYSISRVGNIAGCFVTDGFVTRSSKVRLLRDGKILYDGGLGGLRRVKDDVREVREGFECGLKMANYEDIKVGDVVESYEIQEIARKLE